MTLIAHIARSVMARFIALRPTATSETAGRARSEKRVLRQDIEALLISELGSLPPLAG